MERDLRREIYEKAKRFEERVAATLSPDRPRKSRREIAEGRFE